MPQEKLFYSLKGLSLVVIILLQFLGISCIALQDQHRSLTTIYLSQYFIWVTNCNLVLLIVMACLLGQECAAVPILHRSFINVFHHFYSLTLFRCVFTCLLHTIRFLSLLSNIFDLFMDHLRK